MAQQAQFKKLKEQIEAAKRGLTEISDDEVNHSPTNLPLADHKPSNSATSLANEFQFFHREKQPKGRSGSELSTSFQEANNAASEALLYERLGRRLDTLEGGLEQNRKYILELINLLSQLDLRQRPTKRKLRPSRRLIRRHIFWIVIGFLVVGWFGLTPSGHIAVKHFLTLM